MCGLHDDDLRKMETCWICNVLIVKLHAGIANSVGYNKIGSIQMFLKIQFIHASRWSG